MERESRAPSGPAAGCACWFSRSSPCTPFDPQLPSAPMLATAMVTAGISTFATAIEDGRPPTVRKEHAHTAMLSRQHHKVI